MAKMNGLDMGASDHANSLQPDSGIPQGIIESYKNKYRTMRRQK